LYFHSARHSSGGETDLYVAHRAAIDLPWETPMNLGPAVNSAAPDVAPALTADGQYLFFASQRAGNFDIYVSHRSDIHDDLGWEPAVALPAPVNGPSFDAGPAYFENRHGRPQLYFASDRTNGLGQAGLDIYLTELQADGSWTTPTYVSELNTAFQDNRPSIRVDGLELVMTSSRDGGLHLYAAHRDHVWEPWSTPERIGLPVNTDATETQAVLSSGGRTLYFASNRPGVIGNFDIYAATRAPLNKRPD
jgi:Tol biopolymer transport system component